MSDNRLQFGFIYKWEWHFKDCTEWGSRSSSTVLWFPVSQESRHVSVPVGGRVFIYISKCSEYTRQISFYSNEAFFFSKNNNGYWKMKSQQNLRITTSHGPSVTWFHIQTKMFNIYKFIFVLMQTFFWKSSMATKMRFFFFDLSVACYTFDVIFKCRCKLVDLCNVIVARIDHFNKKWH